VSKDTSEVEEAFLAGELEHESVSEIFFHCLLTVL
jgi:hypothetical protein